jgi:hypothetical protein
MNSVDYLPLFTFLVQSSLAMSDALDRLSVDPANDDVSSALEASLDYGKLLLTKYQLLINFIFALFAFILFTQLLRANTCQNDSRTDESSSSRYKR